MIKLKFSKRIPVLVDVWKCPRCGRKAPYHFYEHATRNYRMDFCRGKVVKDVQLVHVPFWQLESKKQFIEKVCSN